MWNSAEGNGADLAQLCDLLSSSVPVTPGIPGWAKSRTKPARAISERPRGTKA